MIIIGVDFHPEFQQIASVDTETGEFQEKRLVHREEAEKFYRALAGCGPAGTCWNGSQWACTLVRTTAGRVAVRVVDCDAAEIQSKRGRKQKTDRQDAQLILRLMLKDDFPRICVASWEKPG